VKTCGILEQNNLEYRVVLGTLLGIHRGGKLITYDHDVDLAIHSRDVDDLISLVPSLEANGATLLLIDPGLLRIAMFGIRIDLFVYSPQGDCLVHKDHPPPHYRTTLLTEDFDEHTTVTLDGTKLKAPKDIDGYLCATYGDNWRVPINAEFERCRTQKVVMTYGSFDLLHDGHRNLLNKASKLGYSVVVGLSTDAFGLIKGKTHDESYEVRKDKLEKLPSVNLVIPETHWGQKEQDMVTYGVDTLVLGGDQDYSTEKLTCKVVTIDRLPNISTTKLKLKKRYGNKRHR